MEAIKDQLLIKSPVQGAEIENFFNNTTIPQLFFDEDLILRKFSSGAMNKFNLSSFFIGSSINEVQKHLHCPSITKKVKSVISQSKTLVKEIETSDSKWYKIDITPYFKQKENSNKGAVVTFVEITDKIINLKEQEKLIKEYETLLTTISHDIKNGLTSMALSIQMLKESNFATSEDIKLDLETLDNGVNKINLILNDLYHYNNKNKYKSFNEFVIFENILEEVRSSLINEIIETNTILRFEVNCSEIIFPRRELRSIIYNLVSNSIKYRSPDRDPEIFIKIFTKDIYTVISVKDNGIGIEPRNLKKIFSKFFRVENVGEGSGIGLHLVKTMVSKAGGKVICESELGVGSEFKIYLKSKCD